MNKKLLASTALCLAIGAAQAQTFPANWANRFQTVIDSLAQSPTFMTTANNEPIGLSVAVNMPGLGTWQGTAGPSNLAGPALTPAATMGIGSNSKLYTAVLLLKLQENNILSLDDHIGQYIQAPVQHVDTNATIRQLLQHETGTFDYVNDRFNAHIADLFADPAAFWSYNQTVGTIGAPHFPIGRGFSYSNTNYTLCAWIIEQATGQSYAQNLRQYVINPLNLTSTYESALDTAVLNMVTESWSEFGGMWFPRLGSVALSSMTRGGGSIISTPTDQAAFYQAIFNGSFLSAASKEQLMAVEPASHYGLGFYSNFSPVLQSQVYTHTGWAAGFISEATFDRSTGASIMVIANSADISVSLFAPILQVLKSDFPKKATDAGVAAVAWPHGTVCSASISPVIYLHNPGLNTLSSATLHYRINNGPVQNHAYSGNLAAGGYDQVTLPASTVPDGLHTLTVFATDPAGYAHNDTVRTQFRVNAVPAHTGSFSEDFEGATSEVLVWHPFNFTAGQLGVTKLAGASGNHSLARNGYENTFEGDVSFADLPLIQLASGQASVLTFKYAYRNFPGYGDTLQVLVSGDCGNTWNSEFYRGGADLSNNLSTTVHYFPRNPNEWQTASIPLTAYSGNVLVRFRQVNGWSNNSYIDDIAISTVTASASEIAGPQIALYPNPVHDKITLKGVPANTLIRVTDITGREVATATAGAAETIIDMSLIAPGTYLVGSPFGTKKIVKL